MNIISSLNIQQIQPAIGAIIHDLDLNHLDHSRLHQVKAALLDHQVIFFRQQQLTPQSQVVLAQSFGELQLHPIYPTVENVPEVVVLDSLQQDLRDNELWHTDVTFSKIPPLGCVLQAIKVPDQGGDTLWTSATAAFDALEPALQQQLSRLTATHDIRQSFPVDRFAKDELEQEKLQKIFDKNPPIIHPLIRTHPVTGKPILFVNEGFTTKINELSDQDSADLLNFLFQHVTQPQFYLRWKWQVGDVAIWDNRCTQHKALFDYGNAHRIMHRAMVIGDQPFYQASA